jgi:rhodanese-related sulfurtransferase
MTSMQTISREDLKARLDRGDNIRLVMALGEWAFRAKHIPGSVFFNSPKEAFAALNADDEIVVYCTGGDCMASRYAYDRLVERGYRHVYHFAGGLSEWESAGYPVEGEMAGK